jgi:hypothetical protein
MTSIHSYCQIKQNQILKDGKVVLDLKDITLDDFLSKVYEELKVSYPKYYKMDRMSKLGFLASEVLLSDISKSIAPESTAVILTNRHASLDTDTRYWESTQQVASPSLFVYTLPNIVAGEICIRHGFKGENIFFVSEAFEPEWLASNVELTLSRENTNSCLAGWVDVWDNHAEVFLYLASKSSNGIGENSVDNLRRFFNHGTTSY